MSDKQAFGHPGIPPHWTSSSKDGIGTALSDASPVWFTLAYGILNEIYFPRVDSANTRDVQYLVSDGHSFFHEEKRDLDHHTAYADPRALAFCQINSDPDGRYRLIKETITDPYAPVVLVNTRLDVLKPEAGDYQIYALIAPHISNQGMGNSGRLMEMDGRPCLVAERNGIALAVVASIPFLKRSCGFVGASDGWTDLHDNFHMDWQFDSANDGNIALTAELDIKNNHEWVLAIGFGASGMEAAQAAFSSLDRGWGRAYIQYLRGWHSYCDSLADLAPASHDGGRAYYISAMVIRAHEDRLHGGAICASLSIPWGEICGDQNIGGYHLVWPRDLVQAATAALAAGDFELPVRVLRYLSRIQQPDGGMPQNCWVDGRAYWHGIQLDEVAFPIMLAWRLYKLGLLGGFDPYPLVRAGAAYLIREGPVSSEERWEESAGISPSTLAAEISGLVCAAEFARQRNEGQIADLCLRTADYWASNVERWTYTDSGTLMHGHSSYYVRLDTSTPGVIGSQWNPNAGYINIKNKPGGLATYKAADIIDGGFLQLVRYGIRSPHDQHILNALTVYDATLKVEFAAGPCWHRYNHDGYGQQADGTPYDGIGVGRAWPLLTGERGHYELSAGNDSEIYLRAMEKFGNAGGMLPEQLWDTDDIPEQHMYFGQPTGSAMPLVWAHAEYISLLRSRHDKAAFCLLPPVYQRYVEQQVSDEVQVWSFRHKLHHAEASRSLRIVVNAPGLLHWSSDQWQHTADNKLAHEGFDVYSYVFPANRFTAGQELKFTFYWPDVKRWENHDFSITFG